MEPIIKEGAILFISRYHYLFRKPRAGEIIIIRSRLVQGATFTKENEQFIIKRVQRINGDKVFVMGDNKKESIDSREFGWIDKGSIIGKVILR